jgi:hypothetical protein
MSPLKFFSQLHPQKVYWIESFQITLIVKSNRIEAPTNSQRLAEPHARQDQHHNRENSQRDNLEP